MGYCNIVEILKNKREALGLSRREAIDLCNGDISEKTLYRIEKGRLLPSKYAISVLDRTYNNKKERFLQFSDVKGSNIYSEGLGYWAERRYSEAISALNYAMSFTTKEEEREYLKEIIYFILAQKEDKHLLEEEIERFEKVVMAEVPTNLKGEKWPIMDFQTDKLVFLLNMYRKNKMYEKQERLARDIKISVSTSYLESKECSDIFSIAEGALVDALQDSGKHIEAIKEVLYALLFVSKTGNIKNTVFLIYSLVWSCQQMEYFHDKALRKECLSELKKLISLSEICGNDSDVEFFSRKYDEFQSLRI